MAALDTVRYAYASELHSNPSYTLTAIVLWVPTGWVVLNLICSDCGLIGGMRRHPGQREDAVEGIESRGGNSKGQRAGDRQQVAGIRALDVDLRPKDRRIVEVVDVGVGIGNRYTWPAGYDVGPVVLAERRRIVAVEIDLRPVVVVVQRRR